MAEDNFEDENVPSYLDEPIPEVLEEDPEVTEAFEHLAEVEHDVQTQQHKLSPKQVAAALILVAAAPFVALLLFQYIG